MLIDYRRLITCRHTYTYTSYTCTRPRHWWMKGKFYNTFFLSLLLQVDLETDDLERRIHTGPTTLTGEKTEITQTFVNPRNMRLTPLDFELKKVLGKGGYGKVFLVKVRPDWLKCPTKAQRTFSCRLKKLLEVMELHSPWRCSRRHQLCEIRRIQLTHVLNETFWKL